MNWNGSDGTTRNLYFEDNRVVEKIYPNPLNEIWRFGTKCSRHWDIIWPVFMTSGMIAL
jgi:hypothetical protein